MLRLRLKTLMSQRDISTNKICEDLKISKTNFNRYKNNQSQRWDVDVLEKMLFYLDCNVADLVEFSGIFRGKKSDCELSEQDQLNIFSDQLYSLLADLDRVQNKMIKFTSKDNDNYDELLGRLYDAIEEIQSIADSLTPDVDD